MQRAPSFPKSRGIKKPPTETPTQSRTETMDKELKKRDGAKKELSRQFWKPSLVLTALLSAKSKSRPSGLDFDGARAGRPGPCGVCERGAGMIVPANVAAASPAAPSVRTACRCWSRPGPESPPPSPDPCAQTSRRRVIASAACSVRGVPRCEPASKPATEQTPGFLGFWGEWGAVGRGENRVCRVPPFSHIPTAQPSWL